MGPVPLRLLVMAWIGLAVCDEEKEEARWRCPELTRPHVSCMCDMPHTLRCITTDRASFGIIARRLAVLESSAAVSLLDVTMHNETKLPPNILTGVSLHGLVVSSGQLTHISPAAFSGLGSPLQALGLSSNLLKAVPTSALSELSGLERLDLSHNKLVSLNETSFSDCYNLTFVDISENQLQVIAPSTFSQLLELRVLKLRGNHVSLATVSNISCCENLVELDLSRNALVGPLDANTFPSLPSLETLLLGENQISCTRRGMLSGVPNLLTLSVRNNYIDVVEDHTFLELTKLRTLDLAYNRIVAVSGASLSHLAHLTDLDLSHNFLRSLSSDLVVPLVSLRELRLDDNDISIVDSNAFTGRQLARLTLSDNPLNCDCTLTEFAGWLTNKSSLQAADRRTAVCATPPALENALLTDLSAGELHCGDDSDVSSASVPVSNAQAILRAVRFDGSAVTLLWNIDSAAVPYVCDALFIYEDVEGRPEVLLSSTPLRCNSSQSADPTTLAVRVSVDGLRIDHKYRFCVVLLESSRRSDDVRLVLGCSEIVPLTVAAQTQARPSDDSLPHVMPSPARINRVTANLTEDGNLGVAISLSNYFRDPMCRVTITVLAGSSLAAQHHVNCSSAALSITGLPVGPYHVCATLGVHASEEPRVSCVPVSLPNPNKNYPSMLMIAGFLLVVIVIVAAICIVLGRVVRRPRVVTTHQCFLATEVEEGQHARYVKLQATTKV